MATVFKNKPDTNVSESERWISLVAGTGLLAFGLTRRDRTGLGLAAVGTALAWRGAAGHCGFYQALGINTAESNKNAKGTGRRAAIPYELGIRVDHEIRIYKSAEDLYKFWRNFENLPRFMHHIDRVQARQDGTSHWVVRGPAGLRIEWDAEIINEIPNRLIGWQSLPGSQVDNAGSVHFEETGDGQTIVRIALQYNPPAGSVGARVARMFGEDPKEMIREDMERFRELMQTGAVSAKGQTSSPEARKTNDAKWTGGRKMWDRDNVQSASEESFPASDPPSWTPETV